MKPIMRSKALRISSARSPRAWRGSRALESTSFDVATSDRDRHSKGDPDEAIFSVSRKPAARPRGEHPCRRDRSDCRAANATVYIINLKDGDTVTSPFKVQFGLTGMGIAPAGVERPNTGHHHLLVDTTLSPDELKQPIVMDAKHMHFGGGQTEAMVTLPPGQHRLQLGFADWSHVPFNPPIMSPIITITVR
jgi:hypothetical protein